LVEGATYSHYVILVPDRAAVVQEWVEKGVQLGELIQYSIPALSVYEKYNSCHCDAARMASRQTINLPLQLRCV